MKKKEMISKDEAFSQLKSMITRTALIHYAFTRTIIDELGKEKGKELAKKAIRLYGEMVGKKVRENTLAKGLPTLAENFQNDLPTLGWADREKVVVEGEKEHESIPVTWRRPGKSWGSRRSGAFTALWTRPSTRLIIQNWNASTPRMSSTETLTASWPCVRRKRKTDEAFHGREID